MKIKQNEENRLLAMKRYLKISFRTKRSLSEIVMLASQIMQTPVSLITLLDEKTQWIIAHEGIKLKTMPRETSFCTHTIGNDRLLLVEDTLKDKRFSKIPLVKNQPKIRFYAGLPLKSIDGYNIGTLCVFDNKPRNPNLESLKCLQSLANQVANIMSLKLSMGVIENSLELLQKQNKALKEIAYLQSHEVRAPLCSALGAMEMIRMNGYVSDRKYLTILETSLQKLDGKIHEIVENTVVAA